MINYQDPAWCYQCDRDTAFCLCKCYVCDENLEECQCVCAQCNVPVKGGGLCEAHEANWNVEISGPTPDSSNEVGTCEACGIPFNKAFLLNHPHHPRIQRTAYLTKRTLCLSCDLTGRFDDGTLAIQIV